jgi:ribose transport system ATP-binding protein
MPAGAEPLLAIRNLSKTFGGVRALDGVDLTVAPGEIHGLLGANGSGKSTLIKVLAGVHAPDPGARLTLKGRDVELPLHAGAFRKLGLSFVHQNLGLIPSLSVLENLRMSSILDGAAFGLDWRAERRAAAETVARFELGLDLDRSVQELSPVDRALLAIARAFEDLKGGDGRGVLLLDEPTPFLPAAGVRKLFGLMRSIVADGSSAIFISHDVDEILDITDQVTVLRDGRVAGSRATQGSGRDDIVQLILGRRVETAGPARMIKKPAQPSRLRVKEVRGGALQGVDLEVAPGEVVGLTGLIGSGYADLAEFVFGARRAQAGRMDFDGAHDLDLTKQTPRASIARGIAFVPADRPHAGGAGRLSVADNMMLPSLDEFFTTGVLRRRQLFERARELGARFDVRPNRPELNFDALSGGNAQKVVLARWLSRSPRLLLLDEPTQGVDVGTRQQIFGALREEAAKGMSVMVASTDYEQLAAICDRVVIFRRGQIQQALTAPGLTKDAIANACYADTAGTVQGTR